MGPPSPLPQLAPMKQDNALAAEHGHTNKDPNGAQAPIGHWQAGRER